MKYLKYAKSRPHKMAGLSFLIAGTLIFLGIITAESYFPAELAYTTRGNAISDLALASPSTAIFNISMILAGLSVIKGSYFLYKALNNPLITTCLVLFGVGLCGVGIFKTGNSLHTFFALLTFSTVAVAAVLSFRITSRPFRYAALVLGLASLYHLVLLGIFTPILGAGGAERQVAYTTLIWLIAFGGYLLGQNSGSKPSGKIT